MRSVLIICFALLTIAAGEEPAKLPTSAAPVLSAYDGTIAKARAEFEKKEQEARKAAIIGLQKALDAETKKGNLDGALAIRKKIEDLTPKAKPDNGTIDALGNVHWAATLTGTKWAFSEGGWVEFKEGGKAVTGWGEATWKLSENREQVILTIGHFAHNLSKPTGNKIDCVRSDNKNLAMTKVDEATLPR